MFILTGTEWYTGSLGAEGGGGNISSCREQYTGKQEALHPMKTRGRR